MKNTKHNLKKLHDALCQTLTDTGYSFICQPNTPSKANQKALFSAVYVGEIPEDIGEFLGVDMREKAARQKPALFSFINTNWDMDMAAGHGYKVYHGQHASILYGVHPVKGKMSYHVQYFGRKV